MSVMTTTGDPNQVVPLIRERQVLDPVASGQSNKVIARELDISHNTVKLHVRHIMDKLHLRSLMQVRQVGPSSFRVELDLKNTM